MILQIVGQTRVLFPYAIQIYAPNGKDRIVYQLQDPKINPRQLIWEPAQRRLDEALDPLRLDWQKTEVPAAPRPLRGKPACTRRRCSDNFGVRRFITAFGRFAAF